MHPMIREELDGTISMLRTARTLEPATYARLWPTLGDLLHSARCGMDEAREDLAKRAAPQTPADDTSFAAIHQHLSMARLGLMQFAATDAQIDTIARLAVRDGVRASQVCGLSGLTKREASGIISTFQR